MASSRSGARSSGRKAAVERLIGAKDRHRRRLAQLPIKEKISIVIRLQREANEVRRSTGRPPGPVWPE